MEKLNLIYQLQQEARLKDIIFRNKVSNRLFGNQIHALKDVNLSLNEGDRLGIIGHNGAGKSTLLKVIAGIYPPSSGSLEVKGKIASLFELATGFEMEATGWDNIYLRALMLGENPKTVKEKINEIAEFSELGEFLDIPVKYYSSGMFIRLAFSVSTAIEPDILLLDEVIAAGDAKFLLKAKLRMQQLMNKVKILVLVTHSIGSLQDFCNKCIWLDNGQVKMIGLPSEVSSKYLSSGAEELT